MTLTDATTRGPEAELPGLPPSPKSPRRLHRRGRLLVAVVVAAGAVALAVVRPWGGSGDAKSGTAFNDPCTLFSAAELKRYVNVPPTDGGGYFGKPPAGNYSGYVAPFPAGSGMRICRFAHRTLAVEVYIGLAANFPEDPFEKWRKDNGLKPVKGLGSAWRTEHDAVVLSLGGDKVLGIKVGAPSAGHELERAKRLAAAAVERL